MSLSIRLSTLFLEDLESGWGTLVDAQFSFKFNHVGPILIMINLIAKNSPQNKRIAAIFNHRGEGESTTTVRIGGGHRLAQS